SGSLASAVEELGGVARVLLTHRDHVAGGDAWVERFGAEAWIHHSEASAAAYAKNHFGDEREQLWPGVTVLNIPGHTSGSMAFHLDDRLLFTGDSLRWHVRRETLDVFPRQTWQSWSLLADSMEALGELPVEWVLPGHGMWARVGFEEYARQMRTLGTDMRRIGQGNWARRPAP
ncbi:MAG: MBL fold metallo-hydrolase, partial [Propionibacteriaceae bacterium]|nr:MBL fold metallo-hydrolase [Propionibacteriaceae bacterium]